MAVKRKPENRLEQGGVRLPNGQFPPGASGNPGGRPGALADVRDLAREHTPAAVAKLAHIMDKGKSEMACIAAASALLDRGWGKPVQPVSGEHVIKQESRRTGGLAALAQHRIPATSTARSTT
jgi:hypothetical protein